VLFVWYREVMKRFVLLLPVLLVAACAQNPATGGYNFTLTNAREQREIGDATATYTLATEGVYRPTSAATLYVNSLCNRIYAVTEAAAEPAQCNLIDTNEVNAFATPGYLSFHRGLLAYISSEDELASIIGHEAGHLTSRHVARSMTTRRVTDILVTGATAVVAASTPVPNPYAVQGAADIGHQAGTLGRMSFSRDHEREADQLGRRYMQAAGFSPMGSVAAQQAMLLYNGYMDQRMQQAFGGEKASVLDRLKSSHPPSQERLDTALKEAGDQAPLAPEQDIGRKRYMQAIEGVAYGPARRYGIARKNELVLTRERVVLPLPAGTTVEYLSSGSRDDLGTWLVGHAQSGTYLRVNAYESVTGRSPAATLGQLLPALNSGVQRMTVGQPVAANTQAEDEEDIAAMEEATADALADTAGEDIGQLPHREVTGYTATYRYLNSPKRFRMVAFETATRRNKMMVLTVIYPDEATMQKEDGNLMAILRNVRFLTRTQALGYKPLYLHTFTAATGDSAARQASHLPVGAYQEEFFRAMNNLPAGTDMIPGQLYKTIIDPNS